ncbi:MAG: hypothetical protein ACREKN_05030 [Longimicrobiaceae bacterium]
MKRSVSQDELLETLNRELLNHGACDGCEFSGPVFALSEPDRDGCNWNRTAVILTCTGHAAGACRGVAYRIIDQVARRYNLAP